MPTDFEDESKEEPPSRPALPHADRIAHWNFWATLPTAGISFIYFLYEFFRIIPLVAKRGNPSNKLSDWDILLPATLSVFLGGLFAFYVARLNFDKCHREQHDVITHIHHHTTSPIAHQEASHQDADENTRLLSRTPNLPTTPWTCSDRSKVGAFWLYVAINYGGSLSILIESFKLNPYLKWSLATICIILGAMPGLSPAIEWEKSAKEIKGLRTDGTLPFVDLRHNSCWKHLTGVMETITGFVSGSLYFADLVMSAWSAISSIRQRIHLKAFSEGTLYLEEYNLIALVIGSTMGILLAISAKYCHGPHGLAGNSEARTDISIEHALSQYSFTRRQRFFVAFDYLNHILEKTTIATLVISLFDSLVNMPAEAALVIKLLVFALSYPGSEGDNHICRNAVKRQALLRQQSSVNTASADAVTAVRTPQYYPYQQLI